jgi:peroxiredoxin
MNPTAIRRLAAVSLGVLTAGVLAVGSQAKDEAKTTEAKMEVKTEATTTAEVGKKAPDFTLVDIDGKTHSLSDYAGKVVILEWFNPDCPFVKKHHQVHKSMHDAYHVAQEQGAVWLAINSGAPGKQGAGLEYNMEARKNYGIEYPLLLDEAGTVGKAYGARTTPHMFVIAADGTLVYQGAIDDNSSPDKLGETNYVLSTLQSIKAGKAVGTANTKSYGCSVKYGSAS